jgi:hypothetical protein
VVNFYRLFGDSDGDRDVDVKDLFRFLAGFGRRAGLPRYPDYFDFQGDESVDVYDLVQFARRLGWRLPR